MLQKPYRAGGIFSLAFIDFTWHAEVALQKEVLCCGLYGKRQLQHLDWALKNQIHFAFMSDPATWASGIYYSRWLQVTTHQSNGMLKLWNSFLYDQILLKIRKNSGNQGVQVYSQILPFSAVPVPCGVQKPTRSLSSKMLHPLSPVYSGHTMCKGMGCGCFLIQAPQEGSITDSCTALPYRPEEDTCLR